MNTADSLHDLVPLALAVRLVYLHAYGSPPPTAHLVDRLNGLAYSLAAFATMYAIEEATHTPRPLSRDELSVGHFRHGGKELHFLDERPPITHIGVTLVGIEKTANALLRASAQAAAAVDAP